MKINLVGGASTQSRARRPLPRGVVRAVTEGVNGAWETVAFHRPDGTVYRKDLLSWVGGQSGLLWGNGPLPFDSKPYDVHGSYGHVAEYDLAKALGDTYAGCLSSRDLAVRFFQSGGEAAAAAVRIARAVTGRDAIATYGYHGAALDFAHEPAYAGQPRVNLELACQFKWGDLLSLSNAIFENRIATKAACIIVEVPALDDETSIADFLQECRKEADDHRIPFILDEVVTGFRLGPQGACGRYGVKPDMVVLGKAMCATGGVSAVLGRADMVNRLDEDVFYSTTFGGNPGPCSVATATVRWLLKHQIEVYGGWQIHGERQPDGSMSRERFESNGHLRTIGQALKDGFNALGLHCVGQPERSALKFDSDQQWHYFCVRMIEHGVMVHRPQFPTLVHTLSDVEFTLQQAQAVLDEDPDLRPG